MPLTLEHSMSFNNYSGDKILLIYHPAYIETLKIVHLVKNVRNSFFRIERNLFSHCFYLVSLEN